MKQKNKILPIITKEQFVEIIDLVKKQYDKDMSFANSMEKYLDGRCIPMISDYAGLAVEKLMSYIFNDTKKDKYDMNWYSWFVYENDFGLKKMSAWINKKECIIDSSEIFYDFMVEWMNLSKDKKNS